MREIADIHDAARDDMGGLKTFRALPVPGVEQIDPFILLNHHGPVDYPEGNQGLPFEPHPHRGMQTVTFIVDGDVKHKDNSGGESVIEAGGVQWMVAGKGVLHSEVSSEEFKQRGGRLEILQLWVNLPADKKDVEPSYQGIPSSDVPETITGESATVRVVAGEFEGKEGAYDPLTDVEVFWIDFDGDGKFERHVPVTKNILCYVVKGEVEVNGEQVSHQQLVRFDDDDELVRIRGTEGAMIIWGAATPYDEPVVSQGPFVMNTREEIQQAWADLRAGEFGKWRA